MSKSDIKLDISEAKSLISSATRQTIQNVLKQELQKLEEKLKTIEASEPKEPITDAKAQKSYTVTVRNYSWDQSDKFVKFYVSLKGVGAIDKALVTSKFTDRSLFLKVENLDGKNYELNINNLSKSVTADKSYHKVKSDMVVVFLCKADTSKWEAVTGEEQRVLNTKKDKNPKPDSADPSAGLMGLMKQMYDDGDDNMKRTLNKTWYESQQKRGENPGAGFGDMGMGMPDM